MASEVYNPLPQLIDFAARLRFADLPPQVVRETKRRIIDALGCAVGALADERLRERRDYLRRRTVNYAEGGLAFGVREKLSLSDAAFLNSTMIRWLDFNDTYLAKEPAHPSDNLGLLCALAGVRDLSGEELVTVAALAYDVQCRLCEAASLRARGWDHVNYVLVSAALAGAKLLGMDRGQMYNAVAFALNANVALRQAREGAYLSEQKNMAAADAVRGAAWALEKVLAGATAPAEIFEGRHGFIAQVSGPLDPAAFEDLGKRFLIADTYIKQYPVEYHGQTVVEHALALRQALGAPSPDDVEEVLICGYEAQERIIGDESKRRPTTKETADHSLYFAFAAPFLEGEMSLRQYRPELLTSADVLGLIERTRFDEVAEWTQKYFAPQPEREFVSSATVRLADGRTATDVRRFPHGHPTSPMTDQELVEKFLTLAGPFLEQSQGTVNQLWDVDRAPSVAALLAQIVLRGESA